MADPYYSGAAVAAGALSRAVSDVFTGLLEGQKGAGEVREREAKLGQAERKEATEQASFPMEAEALQTRTAGEKQRIAFGAEEQPERMAQLRAHSTIAQAQASRAEHFMDLEVRTAQANLDKINQAVQYAKDLAPWELKSVRAAAEDAGIKLEFLKSQKENFIQGQKDLAGALKELAMLPHPATDQDLQKYLSTFFKYGHVLGKDHPGFAYALELLKLQAKDPAMIKNISDLVMKTDSDARAEAAKVYESLIGKPLTGGGGTVYQGQLYEWLTQVTKNRIAKRLAAINGVPAEVFGARENVPAPAWLKDALSAESERTWGGLFPGVRSPEWTKAAIRKLEETGDLLQAIAAGEAATTQEAPTPAPRQAAPAAPRVPKILGIEKVR